MATSAPRVCSKAGCHRLTATGRCALHPFAPRERTRRDTDYDKRRGSASARGYDSRWKKLRARKINRNPLCEHCFERGEVTPATEVDHRIPIAEAPERRLDWDNLQSLCHPCHVRKTAEDARRLSRPNV